MKRYNHWYTSVWKLERCRLDSGKVEVR